MFYVSVKVVQDSSCLINTTYNLFLLRYIVIFHRSVRGIITVLNRCAVLTRLPTLLQTY